MLKTAILLSTAVVLSVTISAVASGAPAGRGFSARVDNPWFSLRPGTTFTYVGEKDGQPSRDVMTVTHRTAVIGGAPCVVVDDRLYLSGRLAERTTDWYTQDAQGNVWYFGEATAELDRHGRVTGTSGSWRTGVKGAKPGIYMPASPRVGQSGRQEYYRGQAEDHFQVLSLSASVRVPYLHSSHALLTKEWTPLEPGVLDHKLYVRGIGMVLEQSIHGPTERGALIRVNRA